MIDDRLPSLSALRAFAFTAEHGSFSAAGRQLNVTHAAIAQQVRALEAHLGIQLVERRGRGVDLTVPGRMLADDLNAGFSALSAAVRRVLVETERRPVSISMTPSFASDWMMPRLAKLREAEPDIDLMIHPSAALVDLSAGEHDFAIRFGRGDWVDGHADWLMPTTFVIAGAKKFLPGEGAPLVEQLAQCPWLLEIGTEERNLWLKQQGVQVTDGSSVVHLPGNMMLSALREGQGIAATVRLFIEEDVQQGRLHILWEGTSEETGYYLARSKTHLRPTAQAVYDWLLKEAGQEAPQDVP